MIMFADDGGFDRKSEAGPGPTEASSEISAELLEGCRDTVRRAQRLTNQLGLRTTSPRSSDREDRLAWAINAIEANARDSR